MRARRQDPLPLRTMRRERPVTSATRSVPKRWDDLVERGLAQVERRQAFSIIASRPTPGRPRRIPPAGHPRTHGARGQVALAVGEGLVELAPGRNARGSPGHNLPRPRYRRARRFNVVDMIFIPGISRLGIMHYASALNRRRTNPSVVCPLSDITSPPTLTPANPARPAGS